MTTSTEAAAVRSSATTTSIMPPPVLEAGNTVTLRGGEGKKRKYNNEHAVVVEVPSGGCWMCVRTASSREALKWRKRGCIVTDTKITTTTTTRLDPLSVIGEEGMRLVFGYLCGDTNKIDDTYKAGQVHAQLRAVCRTWKKSTDVVVSEWIGLVDLNLNTCGQHGRTASLEMIQWICNSGLHLRSLAVSTAELPDIPVLMRLLLECNTKQLKKMKAYVNINRRYHTEVACFVRQDTRRYSHYYDLTTTNDSNGGYLHHNHASDTKLLHNAIAEQCPKLQELEVTVSVPSANPDYSGYISEALFCMSNIRKLKISFGLLLLNNDELGFWNDFDFDGEVHIEGKVFTHIIQNLSSLTDLTIATTSGTPFHRRRFHIESPTLKRLDVSGATKHVVISCDCPRLEQFCCNGSIPYGNGTLPRLTLTQHQKLAQRIHSVRVRLGAGAEDLVVNAGDYHFPLIHVPPTCIVTLQNYINGCACHPLETYERWIRHFWCAPLITYEEEEEEDGE